MEASVLAAMMSQPRLLRAFRNTLRDYHFESTPLRHVAKLMLASSTVEEAPTHEELAYLIEHHSAPQEWGAELTAAVQEAATAVSQARPTEVSRQVVHQFVVQAEIRLLADKMGATPPAELVRRLPEYKAKLALLESDHASDALALGRNFFGAGPDGLEHTMEVMGKLYDPTYCLPTGWRLFDDIMLGGIRPKEGNVILGPTNGGKSEFLIAFARVFNALGKRVVWYGIDSTEEEMSERIPVSQTGVQIDHTREIGDRKREILALAQRHNLFIYREWSPNRHKISDVRQHLQVVADEMGPLDEAEGRPNPGKTHVILVDSPQLMVPEGTRSKEARRFDVTEIYYNWMALLKDEDLIGIATHQANREAMKAISMGLEHVGEALAAVQPVASVWALPNQRIAERVARTHWVQFLKLRKPEGVGKQIKFCVDRRRQLMWEDPDQAEAANMWEDSGRDDDYEEGGTKFSASGGSRPPRSKKRKVEPAAAAAETAADPTAVDWDELTSALAAPATVPQQTHDKPTTISRRPPPRGIGRAEG